MNLLLRPLACLLGPHLWTAHALPGRVILLRHAEKPPHENDIHLSSKGQERAEALVGYFASKLGVDTNRPPAALFATRPTRGAPSLRTRATLQPLADRLQLPIRQPVTAADFDKLARELLEGPAYHGKTVIVCWAHDELGDFARALGAKPKPKNWKQDTFDTVWVITYRDGRADFRSCPQRLLRGDADK
jgi:hypothetical protein